MSVTNPVSTIQADSTTLQPTEQKSTAGAAHVSLINSATGASVGMRNGGFKVSNEYEPGRDVILNWFFGSDGALRTDFVSSTAKQSAYQDITLYNPATRSIVIVNGDPAPTYGVTVQLSRNGLASTTDDTYTIASLTVASAAQPRILQINVPAAVGYDNFLAITITPGAGQTANQLSFKSYINGRGG